MANERVFDEVDALTVNSVEVGGINSIGITQGHIDTVESDDGNQGPAVRSRGGQKVDLSLVSTDVIDLIALLISTPATAIFYGRESGAATYVKSTIGTATSKLVMHTGALRLSRGAYAQMTVDGTVRSDGADTFTEICKHEDGQSAPTLVFPARLWKPTALTHGTIAVLHPVDANIRITPVLRQDYGDGDAGLSAFDIAGWKVAVEATVRDSDAYLTNSYDICTQLLDQGTKDLVIALEGVGQQGNQELTLRNCAFESRRKAAGKDYTGHTLSGGLQFEDPDSPYTMRTIDHATPAERLINFATPA